MILERVHTNLYSIVGEAVDEVKNDEEKWSPSEMVKRIVGYIYKAAKNPDLQQKTNWQEVSTQIVATAMGSYTAACGERPWFYQLGLGHAFTSAVWELLQATGRPPVHFADVQDFVMQEFESHLDKSLLTKAMWEAIQATFSDDIVRGKVYKAVCNTYYTVLDELLEDSRPLDEARKVERFTKRWIESAMQRAWSSVENSETVLTPGNISRLFQNLIAPFGEAHEYSCIPIMFIENIGRPPRNWKFLRLTVEQLFRSWKEAAANPGPPSKRQKKATAAIFDAYNNGPEEPVDDIPLQPEPANAITAKEEVDPEPEATDFQEEIGAVKEEGGALPGEGPAGEDAEAAGHPECTSEADCIGSPTDNLVRHMLGGDAGDVYCQTCWESFLFQNKTLEGIWEDGEFAGETYRPPEQAS